MSPSKQTLSKADDNEETGIRLQKALAQAGVASRRASEIMIAKGLVTVNGQLITEQGVRVDPAHDVIRVDGRRIPPASDLIYVAMNKPVGVVSTMSDPQGRPSLQDYLDAQSTLRLFHVGRLDTDTSGLLLLTNDGDFSQRVAHPAHEVEKVYVADVKGAPSGWTMKILREGVTLADGLVQPHEVKMIQRSANHSLVQVSLHEGRNRIVRRLFEEVGHPVMQLTRIAIGPVRLGNLKPGQMRELNRTELGEFFDIVGL